MKKVIIAVIAAALIAALAWVPVTQLIEVNGAIRESFPGTDYRVESIGLYPRWMSLIFYCGSPTNEDVDFTATVGKSGVNINDYRMSSRLTVTDRLSREYHSAVMAALEPIKKRFAVELMDAWLEASAERRAEHSIYAPDLTLGGDYDALALAADAGRIRVRLKADSSREEEIRAELRSLLCNTPYYKLELDLRSE